MGDGLLVLLFFVGTLIIIGSVALLLTRFSLKRIFKKNIELKYYLNPIVFAGLLAVYSFSCFLEIMGIAFPASVLTMFYMIVAILIAVIQFLFFLLHLFRKNSLYRAHLLSFAMVIVLSVYFSTFIAITGCFAHV